MGMHQKLVGIFSALPVEFKVRAISASQIYAKQNMLQDDPKKSNKEVDRAPVSLSRKARGPKKELKLDYLFGATGGPKQEPVQPQPVSGLMAYPSTPVAEHHAKSSSGMSDNKWVDIEELLEDIADHPFLPYQ